MLEASLAAPVSREHVAGIHAFTRLRPAVCVRVGSRSCLDHARKQKHLRLEIYMLLQLVPPVLPYHGRHYARASPAVRAQGGEKRPLGGEPVLAWRLGAAKSPVIARKVVLSSAKTP